MVKSKKQKVYTSSDVMFSTESIDEKKKVVIVRDEAPHFLRDPRFHSKTLRDPRFRRKY